MKGRMSYQKVLAAAAVGLWVSLAAAGCSPEFSDEACEVDTDCFPDETCSSAGVCVPGDGANNGVGDAGADALDDADPGADVSLDEVDRIEVEPEEAEIGLGGTLQLTVTAFDDNDDEIVGLDDGDFEWVSLDTEIATVDDTGEVTALSLGPVTISVELLDTPEIDALAEITVVEGEAEVVEVSPSSEVLLVGESAQFMATAFNEAGEEIPEPTVNWTVDFEGDETLAEVDSLGEVTALAPGEVTVVANVEGVEGEAELTIEEVPIDRVEVIPDDETIEVGEEYEIFVTLFDEEDNELEDREITWSTSDDEVAEVDEGMVTGVGVGEATIIIEVGDMEVYADVEVVPANNPPTASDMTVSTHEGTPVDLTLEADDADDDALLFVIVDEPGDGELTGLDADTGEVTYTPDEGFSGTDEFTFEVTDDPGATSQVATVTVEVNAAPIATIDADDSVLVDTSMTLDGTTSSDPDGADGDLEYQWAVTAEPSGSGDYELTDNEDGTATFEASTTGDYEVTLTVEDADGATGSDTAAIEVTEPPNTDPTADNVTAATNQDTPVDIQLEGDDADEGDVVEFAIVDDPTAGQLSGLDASTGEVTYTPEAGFSGIDTFTFQVSDDRGGTSQVATVTVDVNAAPSATIEADDSVVVDTPMTLDGTTSSDPDGADDDLEYEWAVTADASGSGDYELTDNEDGTATFEASTTGDYEVTLTVEDADGATGSDTAAIEVTEPPNTDPTADNVTAATNQDTPVDVQLEGDDADEGDVVEFAIVDDPTDGQLSGLDASTGEVTYTPDEGFSGTDTFTFQVNDDQGGTSQVATVTVEVNAAPEAVIDAADEVEVGTLTQLDGTTSSDPDGTDGDLEFSWEVTDNPGDGGSLTDADTATPEFQADAAGEYEVTLTVTDSEGAADTATATITVTEAEPENTPPEADAPATATVEVDQTVEITGEGSDDDEDDANLEYSWEVTEEGPGEVTLADADTATVTFSADAPGDYEVTLTVTDSEDAADTAEVTVTEADDGTGDETP